MKTVVEFLLAIVFGAGVVIVATGAALILLAIYANGVLHS